MRRRHVPEGFFRLGRNITIVVTLGGVFTLSAMVWLLLAMHKPTVRVPDVVGQRLSRAEILAHDAGLAVEVKNHIHHRTLQANTVVEQWPRAGMTVKRGQTLRVSVSLGPPDLGQTSRGR